MTRPRGLLPTSTLVLAAMLALPTSAPAAVAELGSMAQAVRGSCPDAGVTVVPVAPNERCQAVTRMTGYQAKVGPNRSLYQAPADGRIVAWTVALGKPGPKQTAFFQDRFGTSSMATVVVLDPGKKLSRRVVAKATLVTLNPFFGSVAQFPLTRTLPIKKGQYIALTVSTWAPLLQVGLGNDTSWRSSRAGDSCNDITSQSALVGRRTATAFPCLYRGVRLTYSATFISNPAPA